MKPKRGWTVERPTEPGMYVVTCHEYRRFTCSMKLVHYRRYSKRSRGVYHDQVLVPDGAQFFGPLEPTA